MKTIKKIIIFLKNSFIKNKELFLFGLFSLIITFLLPDTRRFPYDWKINSQWENQDLYAEFSFVYQSIKKPFSISQTQNSETLKFFYYTGEKPSVDLSGLSNLMDEKLTLDVKKIVGQKYRFVLEDSDFLEISDNSRLFLFGPRGDTMEADAGDFHSKAQVISFILSMLRQNGLVDETLSSHLKIQIRQNAFLLQKSSGESDISLSRMQGNIVISEGQLLVKKGQFIDRNLDDLIKYYRELYITGYPNGINKYWVLLGRWILVAFVLIMLHQFLLFFRPNIFEDSSKLLMILSLVLIFFVATLQAYLKDKDWIYFIPLPIVPIVLKAFFDTRLALFTHFLLLLLLGIFLHNVYSFYILHFTAGVFSIITVESIYKRSQLFTSVFKIIAVYILIYFALQLTSGEVFEYGVNNYIKLVINAFLILLAFPLIYSIEKIFGLISDLSLLELLDTNMPLLKELAEKAPGTFHHSLQVSNLAESAASAIGANTLLVRTAALYHDIGKMNHPQYFIENQITGYNPHDELSFEESARVIIDHVKEGIKIARERKLPESIIDFIRTHHGTTKVHYFYKLYLKNFPNNTSSEERFRYPGPTPFSKETAILMLADSVEASCRSLAQTGADKAQMEKQIDQIFESLMEQKQFDHANITLSEISEVNKTLKKKIMNIYHNRIQYPK